MASIEQTDTVLLLRFIPASALALSLVLPIAAQADEKPKQIVLISFDGAHDNALWTKSRDMARRNGAHFTYFLSCTFLMNRDQAKAYQGPGHRPGKSNVGFAHSNEEIRTRIANIWGAHQEGADISSHACGHFDGKDFSKADWLQEFKAAQVALRDAWENSGVPTDEPEGWEDFATHDVKGFRAPYLSTSDGLVAAEKEMGFVYDASLVTRGPMLPKTENGLPRFGLPLIPEGPDHHLVIGMDYNLYVHHSKGVEDPANSKVYEDRSLNAYEAAFKTQYEGDRIPLQLGFHFVEMNAGAYWQALDRFVGDVCHKPDVACVSYSEALPMIAARGGKTASGL
ncbi:polysaccharide deacetylase [Rhizobium sp. B230/85]|uniref:polysaccharide deacetylase n=1 Tax=unclassified Rhizobium TaxID=2613769 RepID=UPI001ADB57FC|nr:MULTISPECIES: polysaccharide deacetylase [unclassified Rhizobium]MBO9132071.1 polysaccharide deacetylase [Rhizobium sp. B209b/85]QXZ97895.1 polysaccharide deacetylase [Rhizobium sp. B230/85]